MLAASGARGEEVAKRWRVGASLGGFSPQNEVESDADNVLRLFTDEGRVSLQFIDPRPDASAFNTLGVRPGPIANVSGQYAFSRFLVLEGSLGYSQTDIGNVEVHAQFDLPDSLDNIGFQFEPFMISAGDATFVPLQFTAMARFRPQARFNPYLGGGIGYQFVDYEISAELDELSRNLDNSIGQQSRMVPGAPEERPNPIVFVSPNAPDIDLSGAVIDMPDTFTWHFVLGAELSFGPRWTGFIDLRYNWAAEEASILFNGGEDLGVSIPDGEDFIGSPAQNTIYGPILVTEGGLIDGGQRRPRPTQPPDTDCALDPFKCLFDRSELDGVPDNGFYYINGGTFDYSAFQFSLGAPLHVLTTVRRSGATSAGTGARSAARRRSGCRFRW